MHCTLFAYSSPSTPPLPLPHSIIREIKRIGGLDTVGVECGAGIMRRVKTELQLAMGVARAHEITDFVKCDVNDCDMPWWTSVSGFETEKVRGAGCNVAVLCSAMCFQIWARSTAPQNACRVVLSCLHCVVVKLPAHFRSVWVLNPWNTSAQPANL
jgi:hypothetical protein